MIEYHAQIRNLHLASAVASGSLFLLRGLLVAAGRGARALSPLARRLSYGIDTVLLASALTLVVMLPAAVYANGWLYAKLALLPVYVALGFLALRSPSGGARQRALFAAAVVAFVAMFMIARSHDPLGPLRALLDG